MGGIGAKARLGNRAINYLVFMLSNLIPPKDRAKQLLNIFLIIC